PNLSSSIGRALSVWRHSHTPPALPSHRSQAQKIQINFTALVSSCSMIPLPRHAPCIIDADSFWESMGVSSAPKAACKSTPSTRRTALAASDAAATHRRASPPPGDSQTTSTLQWWSELPEGRAVGAVCIIQRTVPLFIHPAHHQLAPAAPPTEQGVHTPVRAAQDRSVRPRLGALDACNACMPAQSSGECLLRPLWK
ncbi:hypothetical protein BU23DRAFT_663683, partial [Bimuria novae-zelandiae CBS 107.79]